MIKMKKEVSLVKKVDSLLRRIGCPRFLHHFGPKRYRFVQHATALLLKETLKCSFRRIAKLFALLEIDTPTYSALCKSRKRIPAWIWNEMLKITAGTSSGMVAIDGTGFSRTNPSFHYLNRIDGKTPKRYTKLSALFDLIKKKFTALRIRIKPRHDILDAKPLVQRSKVRKLFGDSAYDAESLHEYCAWNRIQTIIKPKRNARKGFFRKKQMRNYSDKEYHQRSLIESGFGSLKRKYGGYVLAKKDKALKAEIYCKAIAHNLNLS